MWIIHCRKISFILLDNLVLDMFQIKMRELVVPLATRLLALAFCAEFPLLAVLGNGLGQILGSKYFQAARAVLAFLAAGVASESAPFSALAFSRSLFDFFGQSLTR